MDTPHQYSKNGMGEGKPGNINPEEVGKSHPSKDISEIDKLEIKESELGRDQGQTPADEHIDDSFSQIDKGTKQMRENQQSDSMEQTLKKEFDTEDFRRVDERDSEDSTEDFDAEKSRTGRQK